MRHSLLFLVVSTIAVRQLPAQSISGPTPPADQLQHAQELFSRSDWSGTLTAYTAIAREFPNNALARFRVGVSLMELGKYADAEQSLRQGEALGIPAGQAAFRLAQLFAEEHKADDAIAQLQRAAENQLLILPSTLASDRHLASLKSHPRWSEVLDTFDALVQPCKHDAHFHDFDFWVGDWDVRGTGQPPVGPPARNTVTVEDNGCVVMEHWHAPNGSEGQSFNIYDRSYGVWRQTWVDNGGGQHDYRGALKDGNMVFLGDTPAPRGQRGRIPTRLTFFHISQDSVRQFSEVSSDSGRTWQVNYDLMYVRRAPGAKDGKEPTTSRQLSDADRAAIRALDSSFVTGWLRDDTTAVLALFASDAQLLPPGSQPVVGVDAIRGWWWPSDGSRTRIVSFVRSIDEIVGTQDLAFMRGTGTLRWTYTKNGSTSTQSNRSLDLIVMARDATGSWRIIRQMWTTLPS